MVMITLRTSDLQWVDGSTDNPGDHCAHGRVDFRIGNAVFVRPKDDILTVSAAALFLMRTLEGDHTKQDPVAEHNLLFPYSGHSVWPCEGKYSVICMGCPQGVDPEITHYRDRVQVRLGTKKAVVSYKEWKAAVFDFADEVLDFYQRCTPKEEPYDELDRNGWQLFWEEWTTRRNIEPLHAAKH
jgi:hypothetical protein